MPNVTQDIPVFPTTPGSIPYANASGVLASSIGVTPSVAGSVAPMAIITSGSAAPYYATSDGLRSALVHLFDNNPTYVSTAGLAAHFRLESVPLGSITLSAGGTGYPINATNGTVTLSGGDAITPATAHYTSNGSGVITGVVLDTPGLYRSAPNSIVFGGGGTGATAYANMAQIGKTPLNIFHYNLPDTGGDNSGQLTVATGGNGSGTFYQSRDLRPAGTRAWWMSLQGAIETGTDGGSQGVLAFAGMDFGRKEKTTITVDVASGAGVPATITLTSGTGWPVPGAYEYTAPGGGVVNYPATLHAVLRDPTTGNTETFAYTGISGNVLTVSARGVGQTTNFAFAAANGCTAQPDFQSDAYIAQTNTISNGFRAYPANNIYDNQRWAFYVGHRATGGTPDIVKWGIRMNGRMESVVGISLGGATPDGTIPLNVTGRGVVTAGMSVGQSATAPDPTTGGTITTASIGVARITPAGAITGVIMQAGTLAGQMVTVVNESASNAATMATAATSNVSNGTACVIAANTSKVFVWDTGTARWYPHA